MDYYRFNSNSIKARMSWVQEVLGLPVTGQRDKSTVKAIIKFQKINHLPANGVICEKTYNLLYANGGRQININKFKNKESDHART